MRPSRPLHATIALYFALLISEGALRKWFLRDFSDLLFVVRDPLVLLIYVLAWRDGVWQHWRSLIVLWVIAFAALASATVSNAPWLVVLFGLRTDFLHVPLIFILGRVLDRAAVRRYGIAVLVLALVVTTLMVLQFNSPREAFINVGVGGGGGESTQITGALGRVRPPGPFSFVSGAVLFFYLAAAFVVSGWLHPTGWPRVLVVAATLACAAALPVSISRSLLLALLVVAGFGFIAALRERHRLPRFLAPLFVVGVVLVAAADSIYVQAFEARWDEALVAGGGGFRGNVIDRLLEDFRQPVRLAQEAPLTGHGLGLGTVAGARLATGRNEFLLAEIEWSRIVLELGPFVGFAFIAWRAWLAFHLLFSSWRSFRRDGDPLAWLLAGAAFFPVLNTQWGPSTHLGFAVFTAGLCLAAQNEPADESSAEPEAGNDLTGPRSA